MLVLSVTACSTTETDTSGDSAAVGEAATDANPFFAESDLFFGYPPFDRIEDAHYVPAFERGMAEQLAEIDAIVNQGAAPTVENTLVALERSGRTLDRVDRVFSAMTSAHTNDAIEEIRSEMAPRLAAHADQILLDSALFERLQTLYDERDSMELDPESYRLVEEYYKDFVRNSVFVKGYALSQTEAAR